MLVWGLGGRDVEGKGAHSHTSNLFKRGTFQSAGVEVWGGGGPHHVYSPETDPSQLANPPPATPTPAPTKPSPTPTPL